MFYCNILFRIKIFSYILKISHLNIDPCYELNSLKHRCVLNEFTLRTSKVLSINSEIYFSRYLLLRKLFEIRFHAYNIWIILRLWNVLWCHHLNSFLSFFLLRVPLTIILSMCTAPCVHLSRCYLAWKIENSPHAFAFQFLFHGPPRNECLFLRCLERNFPGKREDTVFL